MRIYDLLWLIPLLPLLAFALMFGITYENKRTSAWIGIIAVSAAEVLALIFLFNELARPRVNDVRGSRRLGAQLHRPNQHYKQRREKCSALWQSA